MGTVGMVTDITERKRAEDQLRRSADRLAMLHDMDQAILAAQSPAEIGRAALGRMRRMVPCQRCTVVLFDFERGEAQMIAGYSGGVHLPPAPMPLSELSPGEVLRRGSVRYIEDLEPAWKIRLRSSASSWPRACGRCSRCPSWWKARRSARSTSRRPPRRRSTPSTGISRSRWPPRWPSPFSTPGCGEEIARQTGELERRLAERGAALRAATAELETLLYSVSHDLRAPLRQLIGFSRMLLDESRPASSTRRPCTTPSGSIEAADHMATLVDDLVGLSRIGRQDLFRREVELTTLVEDVVDRLRRVQRRTGHRLADRGAADRASAIRA